VVAKRVRRETCLTTRCDGRDHRNSREGKSPEAWMAEVKKLEGEWKKGFATSYRRGDDRHLFGGGNKQYARAVGRTGCGRVPRSAAGMCPGHKLVPTLGPRMSTGVRERVRQVVCNKAGYSSPELKKMATENTERTRPAQEKKKNGHTICSGGFFFFHSRDVHGGKNRRLKPKPGDRQGARHRGRWAAGTPGQAGDDRGFRCSHGAQAGQPIFARAFVKPPSGTTTRQRIVGTG